MSEWITYIEIILFGYIYIYDHMKKMVFAKALLRLHAAPSKPWATQRRQLRGACLRTPGAASASRGPGRQPLPAAASSVSARAAWRTELPWPRSVHKPVLYTALLESLSFDAVTFIPPLVFRLSLFTVLSLPLFFTLAYIYFIFHVVFMNTVTSYHFFYHY